MKANQLSLARIETMFQDGIVSEFEYLDLLKKYIARRERAMKEGK